MQNQEKWYVIYTKSRHEKRLADKLTIMGSEVYLPLVKSVSLRKDRKQIIEKPLFNSYVFVKESTINLDTLKSYDSFVSYLLFNGRPAIVYQYEIDIIKSLIQHGYNVELTEVDVKQLTEGNKVRVISGPLKGMEGQVYQLINPEFVYVHFENLQGSMKINISYKQLKLI
jgi:transcription antitermination factor NusG